MKKEDDFVLKILATNAESIRVQGEALKSLTDEIKQFKKHTGSSFVHVLESITALEKEVFEDQDKYDVI